MKNNIQILINNIYADIDDDTAIGITINNFNATNPGIISLSHSNSFSLPKTNNNNRIFNYSDSIYYGGTEIYDKYTCEIYTDGFLVLRGKCFIDEINERYNITVISFKEISNELDKIKFSSNNGDVSISSLVSYEANTEIQTNSTYQDLISYSVQTGNMIWLPYAMHTLFNQYPVGELSDDGIIELKNKYDEDQSTLEDASHITTEALSSSVVVGDFKTGCFFANLLRVMQLVFDSIDVEIEFSQNIENELRNQYIRVPDIAIWKTQDENFEFRENTTWKYSIDNNKTYSNSKSALDILKVIMNEYCLTVDSFYDGQTGKYKYVFNSFNDVLNNGVELKFSMSEGIVKNFQIDSLSQESWITYNKLNSTDESSNIGGKQILCKNKNINDGGINESLFKIDRFLTSYINYIDNNTTIETEALDLINADKCDEIIIVTPDDNSTTYSVRVSRYEDLIESESVTTLLTVAKQTSVGNNNYWNLYCDMVEFPVVINTKLKCSSIDIYKIKSFSFCTVENIPGIWYISEVNSFNPRVDDYISVKLIKISNYN